MSTKELLAQFHEIATNPAKVKADYLAKGRKIVLTTYYTPEELIHSMGIVPMAAYGADIQLNEAKKYFPTFICSVLQSILELGMRGTYDGVSAIVIPSLCDSLKCLGENWKYAVPSIPFIPMTYPQNRKPAYGKEFTKAGYERVKEDLIKATGLSFDEEKLKESIKIYNEHNAVMREFSKVAAKHPELSAQDRSDVFKSAGFILKEEHTAMVKELLASLEKDTPQGEKTKVYVSGILADAPAFLEIFDENGLMIAADDIFTQSRLYRTDCITDNEDSAMDALAAKFSAMDNCSLLYDVDKKRVQMIVDEAKAADAKGVILVLTKFCDPEEFDNPLIKKACDAPEADVHFLVGGTQTNYVVIRPILRPYQGVISAVTGHINVHETGAGEATGHKVLALPSKDGKITASQVRAYYDAHWNDADHEHIVQPGMVYISHPTENGTIYSKSELQELYATCKELGLPLFMDGARMGYGLMSEISDMTLADIAANTVVLYIGGSKVGALFGEAVVITKSAIKKDFRYCMKQSVAMLAK